MYLKKLQISNFRNLPGAELALSGKINCFVGNNGAGKTNVLDAVYFLSFCKSYFNQADNQNIRHEQDYFALHGMYSRNGDRDDRVSCVLKRGQRKSFSLNDKEYERLSDHIGMIPLVMISPYDRDLINEGSEVRRKLTDVVISQFDKVYLEQLIQYNRALMQRNALLKKAAESRNFDSSVLDILGIQMAPPAEYIHNRRKDFLNELIPIFRRYFKLISGGREEVDIIYNSQLNGSGFTEALTASIIQDMQLKYTTVGIHKDDLDLVINGFPVKKFGSQGQQKSFVVALKLAQFDYIRNVKGYKPILLLDDIFDKLDNHRVEQLVRLVGEDTFGQVFITDTQQERIAHIFNEFRINHRIFRLSDGMITELESNGL